MGLSLEGLKNLKSLQSLKNKKENKEEKMVEKLDMETLLEEKVGDKEEKTAYNLKK